MMSLTFEEVEVSQVTARLPDELVSSLDVAAARLRRTRADIVRQAVEDYLPGSLEYAVLNKGRVLYE
ncbi:MAG: ribbon-helix-helix protein, CopG family [Ectothiorhodospiraceae bacterium]|jgi:predicted transcriptional regulator|nr:ribbon-helix-helix protein, CopG family [Ectothiorhodospiraceae bacterium]